MFESDTRRFVVEQTETSHYDVIVVGSGACGGWAAMELGQRGARVLVLEAGPMLASDALGDDDWTQERRKERATTEQPIQSRHPSWATTNPNLFVSDVEHPYTTPAEREFLWIRARQSGGRSVTWGAVTLRLSDRELQAPRIDGVGIPWPINYDELVPHYRAVETFFRMRGTPAGLPEQPDGECSGEVPMTVGEGILKETLARRGFGRNLMMTPGILDSPAERAAKGTLFPVQSSLGTTLVEAAKTNKVSLRCDAVVSRIAIDPTTKLANAVEFVDRNSHKVFAARGRAIMMCASTLETTRILLNSGDLITDFANQSGVLGHYLMDHPSVVVLGENTKLKGETLDFGGPNSIYIPFPVVPPRRTVLRGYGIWGGVQRKVGSSPGRVAAQLALVASCEMLPNATNRVVLNHHKPDRWGIPTLHIDCAYRENEKLMMADAGNTVQSYAEAIGFKLLTPRLATTSPGGFAHEVGTARMGNDPRTSFLNRFNQSWAIPNLFVTDGACWPTSAHQNPTLTMIAITRRACTFVVEYLARHGANGAARG